MAATGQLAPEVADSSVVHTRVCELCSSCQPFGAAQLSYSEL